MFSCPSRSRRAFLKTTLFGGVAAATAWQAVHGAEPATAPSARARRPVPGGPAYSTVSVPAAAPAKVALTSSNDRADQVFQALRRLEKEIAGAIGNRPIVVKPNCVIVDNPLSATNADSVGAILEFLKSIRKLENVIIAESPAVGTAMEAYDNYKYTAMAGKYGVKLVELDKQPFEFVSALDEVAMRPRPVRVAKMLLDNNSFVISAATMKTHNLVVATLSLKNIVLGAPIKDETGADKPYLHGNGFWGTNYNLFNLSPRLHPHLAVIDGYQGMEGAGPVSGSPVDHKVCVASLDWVAADHVGATLMGIDPKKMGYLSFAAAAQLGQSDMSKIEILGEAVAKHVKKYQLAPNVEDQYSWKDGPQFG